MEAGRKSQFVDVKRVGKSICAEITIIAFWNIQLAGILRKSLRQWSSLFMVSFTSCSPLWLFSAISSVWGERGKVLRFNFNSMRPYIDINSDTLRAVSGRLGYAAPFPRSTLNRAKAQMGQGAEERKKVGEINLFACHVNFPAFFSSDSKLNLWNSNWSFQSFYITFLSLRAWPLLASERAQFIFLYGLSVLRGESI